MFVQSILPVLSWKNIALFLKCKRCFYKEQVLGKKYPKLDPDCFLLNNTIDSLWKNEFDYCRMYQRSHPVMIKHNIDAIPYTNNHFYIWRDYRSGGINYLDKVNGITLSGVVDDIWVNTKKELIIVDYKTTAKKSLIDNYGKWNLINNEQIAFYGYLLKRNGYKIHNKGYFIFSVIQDQRYFNQTLKFETILKPCFLDDSWIEPTLQSIRLLLDQQTIPKATSDCNFCKYDYIEID